MSEYAASDGGRPSSCSATWCMSPATSATISHMSLVELTLSPTRSSTVELPPSFAQTSVLQVNRSCESPGAASVCGVEQYSANAATR